MAANNSPEKQLTSMLDRLQANGAYSDLKIVCGSDTYLVHRNIICPQSDFFRAACRPDTFAEGRTGVINIPASSGRNDEFFAKPIKVEDFDWDLDVETTESVKLMIHYFYHHDYLERETAKLQGLLFYSDEHRKGIMAEHSRMYAMGEKYGIPGLKSLAVAKFRRAYAGATHTGLAASLVIVYKSTPESDKGLRSLLLGLLSIYGRRYKENTEIQQIISSIPDLCYGLYQRCLEDKILYEDELNEEGR
ncbi:unnamed protein product [Aureobasidium mustum]|uniref:BTB domain-containing protein n=1 Tax=Aureobasidium mustum TaxID=2773714 RepID=A0A9N8JV99_9PEZI|nr:unnamed protein product [Aureobasidium mustum]